MAGVPRYPYDKWGVFFRRPTKAEAAILEEAREQLLRAWDTGNEKAQSSAYWSLRKTIDSMELRTTGRKPKPLGYVPRYPSTRYNKR